MQSYLEKFGANFQVAAFIPSLAFATLAIATLQPVIPHEFLDRLRGIMTFSKAISPDLPLVIVLTIILGFTLSSLNTFIYKLYEGYIVLERFPILVNKQYIRATQIKLKIKRTTCLCIQTQHKTR